jgi:hypothetical protein
MRTNVAMNGDVARMDACSTKRGNTGNNPVTLGL